MALQHHQRLTGNTVLAAGDAAEALRLYYDGMVWEMMRDGVRSRRTPSWQELTELFGNTGVCWWMCGCVYVDCV